MEKASRALLLRVPVLTRSEAPFRPTGGGLLPHPRVVLAIGFTLSAASCFSPGRRRSAAGALDLLPVVPGEGD